ncbi:MAG: PAS domain-containing protein [Luteolibacter sp.]|uniref:PAS domain-containing sensor histidine kinase n=1 Tax=Luteolibacter sp. TaxID=1962973 RepID=UPI0032636F4B
MEGTTHQIDGPDALVHRQAADLLEVNRTLVDSEQRLRLAIETGRIGLWVWNSTDVANSGDWSPRLKEIFAIPLDTEVTHEIFLQRVHPDDRERVNDGVMQALAGANGGEYSSEYQIIHPDDESPRWVRARGQAFFDTEGQAVRFIGTVMDITERKRTEESAARLQTVLEEGIASRTAELARINAALELEIEERKCAERELMQNKRELRLAIDTIPGLVWSSQSDGYIDYLNQRWLEYTGLMLEDASGWGWQAAIHPDDLPGLVAYWKSILGAGEAGEHEARLRRHDGLYRWFLFRAVPLRDAQGQVTKWYGANVDIEDLRASKHLARGQVEGLTRTLEALAKESEPGKFLEHVLRMFVRQLAADSLGVWEMNEHTGRMELVGECENDHVTFAADEERGDPLLSMIPPDAHPLWSEFFLSGERCVIGDLEANPPRIRLDDGNKWHSWLSSVVGNPMVVNMQQRFIDSGVVATLCVPLLLSGEVRGLISLRFKEKRPLGCAEFELARALAHQAMLAIQLVRLSSRSRLTAVAAERNRMARDIHDTLAQGFTGVIVQLEAAEDARSRGLEAESDAHLARARALAGESLNEARRSVQALRPQALTKNDLCGALAEMIEKRTVGTALRGSFSASGEPKPLPEVWEDNLLRVGQEILTNSLRHASASRFEGVLVFTDGELCMEFSDNGSGFDPEAHSEGFGLLGMKERVQQMSGLLTIHSAIGQGCAIRIVLPFSAATI